MYVEIILITLPEEGLAFQVATEPGDDLIPMYRFQSRANCSDSKTKRVAAYLNSVRCLVGVIYTHWSSIGLLDGLAQIPAVEKLIHQTTKNPHPKYQYFNSRFQKFPSYYRRGSLSENQFAEGIKCLILSEQFIEEGLAFYVYGAGEDKGTPFTRFRKNTSLPGTYLFAGPSEASVVNYDGIVSHREFIHPT